ncbi:MAG: hypothetical protein R3Y09_01425 [Clostridia bacterium]
MDTLGRPKVSATRRATAEKKDSTSVKKITFLRKVYFGNIFSVICFRQAEGRR